VGRVSMLLGAWLMGLWFIGFGIFVGSKRHRSSQLSVSSGRPFSAAMLVVLGLVLDCAVAVVLLGR
jgi:hypothetical protein